MNSKIIDIKSARQETKEHQVRCLKCKKYIPKASTKCKYCGINYSKEISEIMYETTPKRKGIYLVLVALLLILILVIVL
jgi:rRNA maturation endonuclease Nob1